MPNHFKLKSKVWVYPSMGAWRFLTVAKKQSKLISELFGDMKRGWGSLPVMVTVGKTKWKTSIFPDKKAGTYLLPLKAEVRKKEGIEDRTTVTFHLEVQL